MSLRLVLPTLALFVAPITPVNAQQYPSHTSVYVNDYAEIIDPAAEQRIIGLLQELRADKGVETTVLTIKSRDDYDYSASIEQFATGLFNDWGVGDSTLNNGILVLVVRGDREMRIELGRGLNRDFDWVAQNVIDDHFLPAFRQDRYSEGIEAGVNATVQNIALPFADGLPPQKRSFADRFAEYRLPALFILAFSALVALSQRQRLGDKSYAFRRCPTCRHRGLKRTRDIELAATKTSEGKGLRHTRCRNCDYSEDHSYTIPMVRTKSSSGGGSFGGGSSSGGGASGRW
ncbi:TPM domain-containing protein [Actibacterium lipolyticum]|uniref:TPM domain-containing protein n=1 Tax=Actibacterium lipolyticum TaxID=1524263 RepID=A0A238KGM4_9RHOB|nr:TPM domain-containing protein [Actibacterium lipolyticum]SMX41704.1 hypothetical protein COL8621_01809 [Actibacterium lipolyticum]